MRKQIIIAALLAAVAATPALAQDRGDHVRGEGRGQGGGNRGEGRQQAAPAQQQQQQQAAALRPAPQMQMQRPQGGQQVQRPQGQQFQRAQGQFQGRAQFQDQAQGNRFQGRPTQWNGQRPVDRPAQVQQQQQRTDAVRTWQGNRGTDPRLQNRDRNGDGVRDNNSRDGNRDGRDWRNNNNANNNGNRDPRFGNNGRNNDNRDWRNNNGGGREWRGNNGGRGQAWNREWRNDNRYNWQSYRSSHRNFYRLPRYQSPYGYGYGYQRFGIGVYLDSQLFGQDYWIDNPYEYRLPEAYPPYHWVRYYNDALLVDEESGYVVDTIYDFFIQ